MKKTPLYLVLFLLIFSYAFILATPALAECACLCANGDRVTVLDPDHCTPTACQSKGGISNPKDCATISSGGSGSGGSSGSSGGSSQVILKDPLNLPGGDPQVFWARIIGALLAFVGVGALITFVYAGFMFLTSSGNPEQVKKAKDTMVYAVLGVAVSMGAYVILGFIFDTLQGPLGQ